MNTVSTAGTPAELPDSTMRSGGGNAIGDVLPDGVATAAPAKVSTRQFLELFSAVVLPMFLAVADQTMLAPATPRIAAELGGLRDTAWISLGYLLAVTITVPIYGRLGDRYGRRRFLLVAVAIFALGSAACGWAADLLQLILARALQGLGGGGLMVLSQALIGELVPGRERGRFQGYMAMNFTIASVAGPLIGGVVVEHGHWRWLFLVNIPLCLLAAWRIRRLPTMTGNPGSALSDLTGILLFAAAAASVLLWVTFGGHRFDWLSSTSLLLGAGAVALSVLLVRRELQQREPFLPVELLRQSLITWMTLTVVLFASCLFAVVFYLPIYLQLGQSVAVAASGGLMLPLSLGIVFGSTGTGRIIAKRGQSYPVPSLGLLLSGLCVAAITWVPADRWLIGLLCLLCGLGFGTVMPTSTITIQRLAGKDKLGAASALVSLGRSTGGALGTAVFGAVAFGLMHSVLGAMPERGAALNQGLSEETRLAVVAAMRWMFGAVAVVCVAAAYCASRVRRVSL